MPFINKASRVTNIMINKGLFRVEMYSLLLRPGSDNSISLWCKLRHTMELSNYRSWFPFWDNCFVWLKFLFFETYTQPFCKRHYPVIVITITWHVLYTGKCTRLYILEIIKAWPLCVLWTRGHAYLLTQLYKIKNVWIMILKQKAFQKLAQSMKLKENQEKNATSRYRTRITGDTKTQCVWSGTVQHRYHSDTLPSITCTVQVNPTSWLRQNNDEKFCKITNMPSWNKITLCLLMNYHITLPFSVSLILFQGGSSS